MQDAYIGDIGDFANNGLLRGLCGTPENPVPGLALGVIEYFNNPNDADLENGQGSKIGYLKVSKSNNSVYRECDPDLYDTLQQLVGWSLVYGKELDLAPIIARNILPIDKRYSCNPLPAGDRTAWLQVAIQEVRDANLVFVNPDTGIASEKQVGSPAHANMADLKQFFEESKSLIIYQHIIRSTNWIENIAEDLEKNLTVNDPLSVWALRWHRDQSRAYFIVPQPKHDHLLRAKTLEFLNGPWGKKWQRWDDPHFTLAYPPEGL